jgi:uroporphyrin-III C-methyltransferase/precorrin-2 dehydrogenase/sirohydrochlorin ferrochelatase
VSSSRWPVRPPYLLGLLLGGRRVVVVGGGAVVQRRLPALLGAGAVVTLVAPEVTPRVQRMVARGELAWIRRPYRAGDVAEAWYVLAATDQPEVNAAVAAEAEQQRTFCVRADQAAQGSAFTPATGEVDGVAVAVLTADGPRRAASVRDAVLHALAARLGRRAA